MNPMFEKWAEEQESRENVFDFFSPMTGLLVWSTVVPYYQQAGTGRKFPLLRDPNTGRWFAVIGEQRCYVPTNIEEI